MGSTPKHLLSFREAGAGQVVLFIHAFPFSSSMWEPQLASLPDGWRAIAPDLAGFGASPRGAKVTSMESHAEDIIALLDDLGVERFVACGLSMGGYVALALHRKYPKRVRALVLADTRAEADTEEGRLKRLDLAKQTKASGMQPVIDGMLPKMITRATRLSRPELLARIEEMMREADPESAVGALTGMARRIDATGMLRDITVPALVIVGAEDEITPKGESQMLARAIRGARIEIIDDAAHLSSFERPDEFNRVLKTFLTTLPAEP